MKKSALLVLLSILSVMIAPFVAHSQCTPGYSSASTGCSSGFGIANFSVSGISSSISDGASCTGSGYQNFYGVDSVVFMQSITYTGSIATGTAYYSYPSMNGEIYIDFNNNSTFEASESVGGVNSFTSSATAVNINIPLTAAVGTHRMRVVTDDPTFDPSYSTPGSINPCATGYTYGEVRDYRVRIVALPACSGAPATGTASATVTLACPSVPFTLSLSGTTVAAGLSYQWQKCSTVSGTYTSISGATTSTFSTTESAPFYYHCVVTCTSTSSASTSNNVFVNYLGVCYCTPFFYYASIACSNYGMSIGQYKVYGESGTVINDSVACDGSGYEDHTSMSATFKQSVSYVSTVWETATTSSFNKNVQNYIDFNDNGTFESSESVGGLNGWITSGVYNLTMPLTAPVGNHRMRVLVYYASSGTPYPSMDPCPATGTYYYGEARDYTINIVALPACSGTPSAGVAFASTGTACPSTPFTLFDTGFSVAGSLSFQWYSSTDSATWTAISGATGLSCSTMESGTRFYHCVVTCTASGSSSISVGVRVGYIGYCYCTPVFYYATVACSRYGMSIGQYKVYGESPTLLNDSVACDGTGYEDHTAMSPVTFMQSVTYVSTVWETATTSSYNKNIQNYIDFNDNGTFETSESVGGHNGWVTSSAYNLTMPLTAPAGHHRMRVLVYYASSGIAYPSLDPCPASGTFYYGEARDYTVNIVALPACSGTPSAGGAIASTGAACPGLSFTLTDTGFSVAGSLSFQWYSSPTGTTWTAISGATGTSYSTTESATTYFHCVVTCTTSGRSDTSASVRVPYITYCYCVPTFSGSSYSCFTYGAAFSKFLVTGESSTAIYDSIACDGTGYEDHTTMSVTFMQSVTYIVTAFQATSTSTTNKNVQTYIDFNDNGTFESSESVGGRNSWVGSTTYSLVMPLTATVGTHRMRSIITTGGTFPTIDPCTTSYYYGEARDYTVNLIALPPCSGTPGAGVSFASTSSACPSTPFTLFDTGFTVAGSLSFQWYSSTDSATWTAITGATSTSYSTTETGTRFYHCVVTCTVSGASSISIGVRVPYIGYCYCTPFFYYASNACTIYGMSIGHYKVYGASPSLLNDSVACDGTGYEDHTTMSVNFMQSVTYVATVWETATTSSYGKNIQNFIDFNDNGTFETSESVGGSNGWIVSRAYNLAMPLTAPVGAHRMRVVVYYNGSGITYPSLDPCPSTGTYFYGEARDYTVNIVPLPPCSGTPTPGNVVSSSITACPSSRFLLSDTGYTVAGSMTFQWQYSSDSATWTSISGATSTSDSMSESASRYYRCVVTCTISGITTYTPGLLVPYVPYCYCTPSFSFASTACSGSYNFSMASFRTSGEYGTAITDSTACDGTGYQNHIGLTVTYMQTRSYADTIVSTTGSFSYSLNNEIWIDYNDNGTFESSEVVGGVNGYTGNPATVVDTFTIPLIGSTLGCHRMRVMQVWATSGSVSGSYPTMDPCAYGYYYGEARDYTACIVALPPCTGTPTGGTTVSNIGTACPSYPIGLTVVGSTLASGFNYIWQRSLDNATWYNISGGTTMTFTTTETVGTYYRRILICASSGGSDTSVSVYVPYISYCYCSPSYSGAAASCGSFNLGTVRYIVPGVGGTGIYDYTHCNGTTNYENNTSMTAALLRGTTDTIKIVNLASSTVNMSVQTWIDFNDNGTFSSSESVGGNANFHDSTYYYIVIPSTAPLGVHRMRTVTHVTGYVSSFPTMDPCCSGYSFGDARDYSINVVSSAGCTGAPTAGSVATTATYGCTSFAPRLTLSGASTGLGITYQWQISATGTSWSDVAGATNDNYTPTVSVNTYFRLMMTCLTSHLTDSTSSIYLTVSPAPSTPTGITYLCSSGSGATGTLAATPTTGTWSSGSPSIATVNAATGTVTGLATGVVNITYTIPSGCYSIGTIYVNPVPFAITGYPSMCVGGSTTLSDPSTGGYWTSSNPSIATVSSAGVVTGISAGSATISYTLSTGCSSSASSAVRTITVNPNPGTILGSYTICLGATSSLTSATAGGAWTSASPSIASVNASGLAYGLTVGTGDVTYTNTSTGCYTSATLTVHPNVTPTLSIAATPGLSVCSGSSVTFTSTTTHAGTLPTFVWSVNGLIVAGSTNYTYAPANGDVVSLWLRSSEACASPDTLRASLSTTVFPSLMPSVSLSTGRGDTVCLGATTTLTATPVGGGTAPVYSWWINGVSTGTTAPVYAYVPANGDVIKVRVTSNDGCRLADTGSTTKVLTVLATATPAVGLTASSGPIACAGSVVNYVATPTAGGSAPGYQWSVNRGLVGTGTTYSYMPTNGDTVKVVMTSDFPCITTATASNSIVMTVDPVVSPVGTITASPGYIVAPGTYVTFTCNIVSGAGTFPSYQWTRNSATIVGATNATFVTNTLSTGDVVSCIVANNDPCNGMSTFTGITVTVTSGPGVGVQPVNNGKVDVTVLPNPNRGSFTIKGSLGVSNDEPVTVEITDMLGQIIYSQSLKTKGGELNQAISLDGTLANGMYLLNVKSEHISKVFHFVIEQ